MVSYEKKLKKTQSYFNKNMNVLEIGCGTGMTGVLHAPFVKEYVATDISSQMVDLARKRAFEASVKNMKFEVNSYNNLSIPDGSMDAVLAMSLLHLVQTPDDCLRIIHKKLRKDGLFISSTMCLGDKMNFLKVVLPVMRFFGLAPAGSVQFFKKDTLLDSFERNNFTIEYQWQPSDTKACFVVAKKT
jgi:ubiquinone/menaquinone biosynthesis C-methylase UbiE